MSFIKSIANYDNGIFTFYSVLHVFKNLFYQRYGKVSRLWVIYLVFKYPLKMQIPKTDSIKEVLRTIITYKKKKLVMKKSVGA